MMEFREFEIYGQPSEETLASFDGFTESGATLTVYSSFVDGYLRLSQPRTST